MRFGTWALVAIVCASAGLAGCAGPAAAPQNEPPLAPPLAPGAIAAWRGAAPHSRAGEVVLTALNYIDVPYKAAGQSADAGFDCSGFTREVFAQSLGVTLPRQADEQARTPELRGVRRDELQPGDLVFFNTLRRTYSHVGIYLGEGRFIHAPRTGAQVRVEQIDAAYWSRRYTGARRHAALASP
ncbi:MAG: C40 family peptidase [Burkholderiaceae bacterium]